MNLTDLQAREFWRLWHADFTCAIWWAKGIRDQQRAWSENDWVIFFHDLARALDCWRAPIERRVRPLDGLEGWDVTSTDRATGLARKIRSLYLTMDALDAENESTDLLRAALDSAAEENG
jgi:hypothetical protein